MGAASLLVSLWLASVDGGARPAKAVAPPAKAAPAAISGFHILQPGAPPAEAPAAGTDTSREARHPAGRVPPQPPGTGARPAPAAAVTDVRDATARLARALAARNLEALVQLTPAPFSFDGVEARTDAQVRERWAEILDRHPVERLRLFGVEVMSYDDAVKKYGKPPTRLAGVSLQGSTVAVANLSGRATVVVWRKRARGFTAVAISD